MTPDVLQRLARGLVVREMERQDIARLNGTRVKAYTEAVAKLDGFADAVHRVVNAWGPQQVLEAVRGVVGEVPQFTSAGRNQWLQEHTLRLADALSWILQDEASW